MKKIAPLLAFLLLLIHGYSSAQNKFLKAKPEERASRMTQTIDKVVSLNTLQKTSVYQICLERVKMMDQNRLVNASNKVAFEKQKKTIIDTWDKKLHKVLTKEQTKTLENYRKEQLAKSKAKEDE